MRNIVKSALGSLALVAFLSGCSAVSPQNVAEQVFEIYDSERTDILNNHLGDEYASCVLGGRLVEDDIYDIFLFKSYVDLDTHDVDLSNVLMMSVAKNHGDFEEVEVELEVGMTGFRLENYPLHGVAEVMVNRSVISGYKAASGKVTPSEDVVRYGESLWVVSDLGERFKYLVKSSTLHELVQEDTEYGTIQLPLVQSKTSFGSTVNMSTRWYSSSSFDDDPYLDGYESDAAEVIELLICPTSKSIPEV